MRQHEGARSQPRELQSGAASNRGSLGMRTEREGRGRALLLAGSGAGGKRGKRGEGSGGVEARDCRSDTRQGRAAWAHYLVM